MGFTSRLIKRRKQNLKPNASKNALALIEEFDLDIRKIKGSGKNGKVRVPDVWSYQSSLENQEEE